jgi:Zn-dependent M28 family amino/carboxypeptidase
MIRSALLTAGFITLAACAGPQPEAGMDAQPVAAMAQEAPASGVEIALQDCAAVQASSALTDLCVLSHDVMEGRLVGTPGNALARGYLIERFEALGLQPLGDSFEHPFRFQRRIDFRDPDSERQTINAVNLIARIPGADSSKVMAVTAHYDHVGPGENNEIFNGADDNASGVAGVLAVAEHFLANPPAHDVVIIAFDAEEGGLNGARHFVANLPEGVGEVVFNLNLDMLGYSPDGDIWAAGSYHTPGLLPIVEAAADVASVDLKAGYDFPTGDPREDWTLLSDHGPFHVAGISFLYIGVEDHEHYHQPSDEFSTIDPEFFTGVVDMVVDVAERSDEALSEIAVMERRGEGE